jgi:hypothetical protein
VNLSAKGRACGAGGCPRIGSRIISPTGVVIVTAVSAPDDHFFASPDSSVSEPGDGRIGGAGGSPTVCARIVSPASVQAVNAISGPAPDNHFIAAPHCCGEHSAIGRIRDAGGCPRVVSARRTPFRNIVERLMSTVTLLALRCVNIFYSKRVKVGETFFLPN